MIKNTHIKASTKKRSIYRQIGQIIVLNSRTSRSVSVVKVDEVSSIVEVGVTVLEDVDDCFC